MLFFALLAPAVPGCVPVPEREDDSGTDAVVDGRIDVPDPEGTSVRLVGAEVILEPHQDVMYCEVGTWEWGDAAVSRFAWFQNPEYAHHFMFMETDFTPDEHADGEVVDCTHPKVIPMEHMQPLVMGTRVLADAWGAMELPPGVAVSVPADTRYILQEHWINATDRRVLVQDLANITFVDPATVTDWATPFIHDNSTFSLPPGQASSATIDCEWEADYTLVALMGHMHEWGRSYSIDWIHGDITERVYEVDNWTPDLRDAPRVDAFEPGAFVVSEGDRFLTTCNWVNDTDEALQFPTEMCDSVGLVYPSAASIKCEPAKDQTPR